jgi:predicted dehydrogenase
MKFLIAGLGSIGRRHLCNLLALGEKDILLYRTYQSTLSDDELAGYPVETDLGVALAQRPDAVIVSNPTALHLKVAIPSARQGCHLLLEKPVAESMEGVADLFEAVEEGSGEVLVGYQFRFHPGLIQAKKLLSENAIGRPISFRAVYAEYLPGMHPWEDYRRSYSARCDLGGGVILTLCHPLDYVRWLLGEFDSVWAFASELNQFDLPVEDSAEIGIRLVNGVIGSVHLDYNRRPASHHLEITGTDGTIDWDATRGDLQIYRAGKAAWESIPNPPGFERNEMFLAEMRHFIAVTQRRSTPICNLKDGVQVLQAALAAKSSAVDGKIYKWW